MFDHSPTSLASAPCGRTIETTPIVPPATYNNPSARARIELSPATSSAPAAPTPPMNDVSADVAAPLRHTTNPPYASPDDLGCVVPCPIRGGGHKSGSHTARRSYRGARG